MLANLAAGCALYDAFQNDPEGNNSGNNGGDCNNSLTVDGAPERCFVGCTVATEYSSALSEDKLNACEEGSEVCQAVMPEAGRNAGVCLTQDERAACSFRSFSDFAVGDFEPCGGDAAEFHVSARPSGGYVVAGCRKSASQGFGVNVVWLDDFGRISESEDTSSRFISLDSIAGDIQVPARADFPPRVRALEAVSQKSALVIFDAETTTSGGERFLAAGVATEGSSSLGDSVRSVGSLSECANGIQGAVGLAGAGEYWVVGSCFVDAQDGNSTKIGFSSIELDSSEQNIANVRPAVEQIDADTLVLQDLTFNDRYSTVEAGNPTISSLVLEVDTTSLVSRRLSRNSDTTQQFAYTTANGRVTTGEGTVGTPEPSGLGITPTASHVLLDDDSTNVVMAGQDVSAAAPKVFARALGQANSLGSKTFGGTPGAPPEQVLDIVAVAVDSGEASAEPKPAPRIVTSWAMLTLVGTGPQAHGRVYGLDGDMNALWTAEVGNGGDFVPREMAVSNSGAGGLAVVGRTRAGEARVYVTDVVGRGYCPQRKLETFYASN